MLVEYFGQSIGAVGSCQSAVNTTTSRMAIAIRDLIIRREPNQAQPAPLIAETSTARTKPQVVEVSR